MQLTLIGTGHLGEALAQSLAFAGHEIISASSTPTRGFGNKHAISDLVGRTDATILAIPFAALSDTIVAADGFPGKLLIDATNPFDSIDGHRSRVIGLPGSGAEQVSAMAPRANVLKIFIQPDFAHIADIRRCDNAPLMFVVGEDAAGKARFLRLASQAGFDAIDAGGIRAARLLEPLVVLCTELSRGIVSSVAHRSARIAQRHVVTAAEPL